MRVEYRHGTSPDAFADLAAESVGAIVCDPPYGTQAKNAIYGRRGRWEDKGRISNDEDVSALGSVALEMMRVLKRFGVALVCCAPTKRSDACNALEEGGLRIVAVVTWDKGAPGISYGVRYSHEDVIIAAQWGAGDPFDSREPLISPIRVPRVKYTEHPNEKPVGLYRKLIQWATNGESQLILDPFAGIASCGVAAIAERCDYIGVECDERWWTVAERRLAEAQNNPHPDIEQDSLFGDVA